MAGLAAATLLALFATPSAIVSAQIAEPQLSGAVHRIVAVRRGYLKTPGVSVAIDGPDDTTLTVTHGFADPDAGEPVIAQTRFMSGSTGKTFAAATVMRLVEDGRIGLDDRVADRFGGQDWYDALPNSDTVTIRHLLQHQAGFPQFLELGSFQRTLLFDRIMHRPTTYSPRRMLAFIANTDPLFPAGEGHHYSDLNYHLLGLVIEDVTGTDYYTALRREVLARMTAYADDIVPANTTQIDRLATGYAKGDLLGRLARTNGRTTYPDGELRFDPSLEYTGGGLAVTPRALARFYSDLAEGRIVRPETFQRMVDAHEDQPDWTPGATAYGLGFYVTEREGLGRYISHSGFFPGYTSNVGYFLDHGFAVAIQQNSDHGPDLFSRLRAIAREVIDHADNGTATGEET